LPAVFRSEGTAWEASKYEGDSDNAIKSLRAFAAKKKRW
jgi:hypothetical protein